MDRSARRWLAYLVVTPLGLMPLGGCSNATVEPAAQVEAERGIPPLLLPRADALRSLGQESAEQAPRTTLADRVILAETLRRLPPVEDLSGSMSHEPFGQVLRTADGRYSNARYENFKVVPLPPLTEVHGADDGTEYVAGLPQSVVVQPQVVPVPEAANVDSDVLEVPDLDWPSEGSGESIQSNEAAEESEVNELAEVEEPDTAPAISVDSPPPIPSQPVPSLPTYQESVPLAPALDIAEPAPAAPAPQFGNVHEATVATPDSMYEIRPLPPISESEMAPSLPELVPVARKSAEISPSLTQLPVGQPISERTKAMRVISEQAAVHVRRGMSLASRNAHYSARSEFIQALRLISQALDVANDSHEYTESLSNGLRALEEADDFVPRGSQLEADLNLEALVRSHRTPTLKTEDPKSLRPIFARQRYYEYAQQQLAHCAEGDRAGSMALYGLAKMRAALAEQQNELTTLELPKAMALYQSAMLVDGDNYMASNELGVLLARYGQYDSAQSMLEHSARVKPQAATWHNLAVVYQHLGKSSEVQLAKRKQAQLAQAQRTSRTSDAGVVWKPVEEFNRETARTQAPVSHTPAKTAAAGSKPNGEKSGEKR